MFSYSKDLVFSVVADVQKYPLFVPACQGVFIKADSPNSHFLTDPVRTADMKKDACISAEMAIGFQGFSERYLSQVLIGILWESYSMWPLL